MLFLDTHAVAWLYAKREELFTATALELVEKQDLHISPMVQLELEYLYETNRISARAPDIIDYLASSIQLQIDTQSFSQIIGQAMRLKWTRDPFDRIITAHAELSDAMLLTKDRKIHSYYINAVW